MSVDTTYAAMSWLVAYSIADIVLISGVVMFLPGIEQCCQGPMTLLSVLVFGLTLSLRVACIHNIVVLLVVVVLQLGLFGLLG